MQRFNFNLKIGLSIAASIAFLYLAMRQIEFSRLWGFVKTANYWYFIPAVTVVPLSFVIRAFRWRYLLRPLKWPAYTSAYHAVAIAFLINNIFPLRLGEFARAYVIGEKENMSKAGAFATVIWERVFDGFMLIPYFILLCFLPFDIPATLKTGTWMLMGFFAGVAGVLIGLAFMREGTARIIYRLVKLLPARLQQTTNMFIGMLLSGIDTVKNPRAILPIIGLSFVVTLCLFLNLKFAVTAFFGDSLHWTSSILIFVGLNFAVLLPATPGYVGTFHAACVFALKQFGVDESQAFGFALVYHAANYIPSTLPGLISLLSQNISLRQIRADANSEKLS